MDEWRIVWAVVNSGLILAVVGWARHQNAKVNAMYQHLFGVPGEKENGGTTGRLRAVERKLEAAVSDTSESAAGREINRSLGLLHKALAEAADAAKLAKTELGDRLGGIEKRLLTLEARKGR